MEMIAELDKILSSNMVDEIGITLDSSLPPIFFTEGKLGIAKSALKTLFCYAFSEINGFDISEINETISTPLSNHIQSITRLILVLKGDSSLAYNIRKKLVELKTIEIAKEMNLLALIFTRHPKCPSGWQHRRWCLLRNTCYKQSKSISIAEIETERELCTTMAEKSPKNYYAWVHRLWILKYMNKYQLLDELDFTNTWLLSHVSDHCASNHRIQVAMHITQSKDVDCIRYILLQLNLISEPVKQVESETTGCTITEATIQSMAAPVGQQSLQYEDSTHKLLFLQQYMLTSSAHLITHRPGHESLWYHRRTLIEILLLNKLEQLQQLSVSSTAVIEPLLTINSIKYDWHSFCPDIINTSNTNISSDITAVNVGNATSNTASREETATNNNSIIISSLLKEWVVLIVRDEIGFVNKCISSCATTTSFHQQEHKIVQWDENKIQCNQALRYATYLLSRVIKYVSNSNNNNHCSKSYFNNHHNIPTSENEYNKSNSNNSNTMTTTYLITNNYAATNRLLLITAMKVALQHIYQYLCSFEEGNYSMILSELV